MSWKVREGMVVLTADGARLGTVVRSGEVLHEGPVDGLHS